MGKASRCSRLSKFQGFYMTVLSRARMKIQKTIEYLESVGCEIISISIKNIPLMNTGHLIAISAEGSEGARNVISI